MQFNAHLNLKNQHAFLSASKYHWVNYDVAKLKNSFFNMAAVQRGTELHNFAAQCIKLRQKLPRSKKTLNLYVNDAIDYRMAPEQILYYSDNCFGTADSISFEKNLLRIHDLKTGEVPAHMEQLEIYAALFCLEYNKKPSALDMELRIYQNNEIIVFSPSVDDIVPVMDKIVTFNKYIEKWKAEEVK